MDTKTFDNQFKDTKKESLDNVIKLSEKQRWKSVSKKITKPVHQEFIDKIGDGR